MSVLVGKRERHLASMMGTDTYGYAAADLPKPAALILGYPVVDFSTGGIIAICKAMAFGLFPSGEKVDHGYAPNHFTSDSPATYIWHGINDETVPYELSTKILYERIQVAGIPSEQFAVQDAPHGMSLAKDSEADGWLAEAVEFWEGQRS